MSYAFARRPKWLLLHLFVVALVVVMVSAGFWQLRRLDERRDRNAIVEARTAEARVPIQTLVTPDDDIAIGADLEYRPVQATGVYQPASEVRIRNRSLGGRPGTWVMTPMLLDDGTLVAVSRGFVPAGLPAESVTPPAGEVTVVGTVQRSRTAEGLQAADPTEGVLAELNHPDLARYARQLDAPLLPVFVQLVSQQPPGDEPPFPVPLPTLDEGPHLGYAVQWFIFSTIAAVGYPLVLRRVGEGESGDRRRSQIPDEYL